MTTTTLDAKVQTFEGERCYPDLKSIPGGVDGEYCRDHGISVIAGACPMMYCADTDFPHTCMRWVLRLIGGLPA